jgi:hypothetical protein
VPPRIFNGCALTPVATETTSRNANRIRTAVAGCSRPGERPIRLLLWVKFAPCARDRVYTRKAELAVRGSAAAMAAPRFSAFPYRHGRNQQGYNRVGPRPTKKTIYGEPD